MSVLHHLILLENIFKWSRTSKKINQTGQVDLELPNLDKFLAKHTTKVEQELSTHQNLKRKFKRQKRNCGNTYELNGKKRGGMSNGEPGHKKCDILEVPSLVKFLVKHVSRLEREVEEVKSRRKNDLVEKGKVVNLGNEVLFYKTNVTCTNDEVSGKQNINLNREDFGPKKKE
ncbi:hypothetical protein DITRI_Ditri08aG0103600 [Diplodiscus trichospermus]